MLPITTVGLTPAGVAAVERIPGDRPVHHFETAEQAIWSFGQERVTGGHDTPGAPIELDAAGEKWLTHVVYGDDAIGPLLAHTQQDARPVRIPAIGLVMVVTDSMGDDQFKPRRMIDGTPESRAVQIQSAQAVKLLGAQAFLAVDKLSDTPHWPAAILHQLERQEEVRPEIQPLANPGAEAAAAQAQLSALLRSGQHRPGLFENRDRQR